MPHFRIREALACLLACFASGCGGTGPDAPPGPAAAAPAGASAAGYATGRVTMEGGGPDTAPGASIEVSIQGITEAGARVGYTPVMAPDGSYRQKLAPGSYSFSTSTIELPFEGANYVFALEPVGDAHARNRESADGIVQDFVWRLTGERRGGDHDLNNATNWYGGSIGVRMATWRNDKNAAPPLLPDGTPVTFTLKPTTARQIDGTEAKPITIERKFDARWTRCDSLVGIPVAHYELSGVATLPGGATKPLLFEVTYAKFSPVQPIRLDPYPTTRNVFTPLTAWVTE